MPLFQTSVLKKYLKQQDSEAVAKAFKKFTKYFHEPKIQENIRSSKEEEYQGIFLTELFSKILGYTMKPNADFNLVAEYKNEKNSRKADGAILKDNEALGVIELKGTNTKDLEKVRQQAFDYKANQTGCVYVITSNFEKIRFYINNAVDFEEFDLFNINQERFELLYLCLAQENLLNNVPLKIKEASVQEEEAITKKFYTDYSAFKRELFRDLVKLNMKNEVFRAELNIEDAARANKNIKHNLFKKSQKLIDRFLFIFFAEDRGLLPPNSTVKILEQWDKLKELDEVVPLYSRYKKYFNYLDTGRKGTDKTAEIFAYNGGLFKPDSVLDSLIISDELLAKHTNALQAYDFESQVDVNILGHIFENSLNEIESVNAEIEGTDFDKQKTKRKKDGVFYTPKYITKYIVDNTIGKLCTEKKDELKILEEDFNPKRQKETKKKLLASLETYREWLLQLTICDPACGSGAFLNQALDFLIKEHQDIDELQTNLLGGGLVFPNIENTVLENNIFGVDLNEESVEIAKLSLWLRTAQPRRKLNTLNNNIKCGNSLIDSKAVAGDKAFNWEEEFPNVFAKGGFDVVVGNPPYVQSHALDEKTKDYIYKNYSTAEYQINTYGVFIEKIFNLIKDEMPFSVIIPNYWLSTQYDSRLRTEVFLQNHCIEILNVFSVFEDATVDTVILTVKKTRENKFPKATNVIAVNRNLENIELRLSAIDNRAWFFNKIETFENINSSISISFDHKLELKGVHSIGEFVAGYQGMKPYEKGKGTPTQTREMMNEKVYHSENKLDDAFLPLIGARNVQRFNLRKSTGFIKYGRNLAAPRKLEIFEGDRLILNRILSKSRIDVTFINQTIINNTDVFNFIPKDGKGKYIKTVLAILASNMCSAFFKKSNVNLDRKAFPKLNVNHIEKFPIPEINEKVNSGFIEIIDDVLELNEEYAKLNSKFSKFFQSNFKLVKLPRNLQNWHELDFSDFINELNKAIKKVGGEKLTKTDEMDWMDVFETKKAEAQTLKTEIDKTDIEIDAMVYKLYKLTDEEIQIVENN